MMSGGVASFVRGLDVLVLSLQLSLVPDVSVQGRDLWGDSESQDGSLSCPMVGKRTPELVLGKHLDHLRECHMGRRTFLERELLPHKGGVPRKDLVILISEYDIAFHAFVPLLELKTGFTQSLPFALAGLASSDEVAAKSLALRLIDVFDSSSQTRTTASRRHS